jgi:NitT/TauT family transport system substrate-binding protein
MRDYTRRKFLKTLGMTGGLFALESLYSKSSVPRSQAQQITEVTTTITWWPSLPYHLPVSVAQKKGWLEEESIRIKEMVGSKGGGTTVRNIVTGGLPFGETATAAAVNAYYAGEPVIIFGVGAATPGHICWVVLPDSPVNKLEDLKGKTISYTSPGSVTESLAALILKRTGLIGEVKMKAMGGIAEGLTALKRKAVDAATIMEPILTRQRNENWRVIFKARDFIPHYLQTVWIAGPQTIQNQSDVLARFLRARARGVEFIKSNLEEAAKIFAETSDLSEEIALISLKNIDPVSYYSDGTFDQEGLDLVGEGMQTVGLIDHTVEWSKLITQDFLPAEKRIQLS